RWMLAIGGLAPRARRTVAAPDRPVHQVRRSDLEAPHPGAERLHPARRLVPEYERRRHEPGDVRLELVEDRHVRVARACAGHLEEHLARARLGHVDVLEGREALPVTEPESPQGRLLRSSPPPSRTL